VHPLGECRHDLLPGSIGDGLLEARCDLHFSPLLCRISTLN
jgi:hypothetical protein